MTAAASILFAKRLIFPRTLKKSSARRSILGAVVCIAISIVPLTAVISVADAMISGMTERLIGLSSLHLRSVVRRNADAAATLDGLAAYKTALTKVPGVTNAFMEIDCDALAAGKNYRTGASVRAVEPDIFTRNAYFAKFIKTVDGTIEDFVNNPKSAVIGEKAANLLSVRAGDTVRLITTKRLPSGIIAPRLTSFTVAAVVSSGYQELDALWFFIPIETGFSIIPKDSAIVSVMMECKDAFSPLLYGIQNECASLLNGEATVFRWDELNASQLENFSSTKLMLVFIMTLIVLVAAVNISSALIMLVMERRREIAILKSLGGTPNGITLSFLLTGLAAGCAGLLIGLPFGLLVSVNINKIISFIENALNLILKIVYIIGGGSTGFDSFRLLNPDYYLTEIPVSVPFAELFFMCGAVMLLSLAVSILPAVKAGKENPLEIFRKS